MSHIQQIRETSPIRDLEVEEVPNFKIVVHLSFLIACISYMDQLNFGHGQMMNNDRDQYVWNLYLVSFTTA